MSAPARFAAQVFSRTLGPRLLKKAAEKAPYGFMEAAQNAARIGGVGDAVMRIGPDIGFPVVAAAMGSPGGWPAGVVDAVTGLGLSYGGDVLGAGLGAMVGGRKGAQVGQMAGGMGGNLLQMVLPVEANPFRSDAIKKMQQEQEQQLAGLMRQGGRSQAVIEPEVAPISDSYSQIAAGADPEEVYREYLIRQIGY